MRRMTLILLLAVAISFPGFAGAVSEKDFEAKTTEEMIKLCTVSRTFVEEGVAWLKEMAKGAAP